jgi:osmotically-inducible protein OsmY
MSALRIAAPVDDQLLETRVIDHLRETQRPGLRRLIVEVKAGTVYLRGRVSSFYEKQLAIHSCIRAAGIGRLIDRVEVAPG